MSTHTFGLTAVVMFCIIGFYAAHRLTESPPTWYDEGIYIQVAQSFADHGGQDMQLAPGVFERIDFLTIGYPVIMPVALSLKIFGDSLLAARAPMVLYILFFAAAAYQLIYRLYGQRVALMSLALLGTFPLLYGNGKNMLGEIPGLFFASLSLIALERLQKNDFQGAWHYVFLGIATGLTAASKPIFLLLPAGIAIALLFNIRTIPLRWKEIVIGALSFVIPMLAWAYFQFGPEASLSAILGYYANPYGVASVTNTVAENVVRFFKEATPLYAAALMGAWTIAFGIRLYHQQKISLAEQSALVFSVLVLLAYLRTAGWYRYFFEAMAMALIFLAPSLETISASVLRANARIPRIFEFLAPALVCSLVLMQFYQLNFSSWVAEYYQSSRSAQVAAYFAEYPTERSIFIYNSPAAVVFLPHRNYYQYMQPTDAIGYGAEELKLLSQAVPDDILLSPETYASNPELFANYAPSGMAAAYMILSRK